MLIKPDPTATNPSPAMPAATVCGNCGAEERRLLHQVRHRSVFRRLCTTCVLRLHPQGFCPSCFQVYTPTPPNDAVRTCIKCYSHSHSHCLEPAASAVAATPSNPYVCPLCVHPNAPLFKLKSAKEANVEIGEDCRVMDRHAARMLLAAAKIASASMNKAAVAAKAEAERRVKEAAFTRKRAKEALEHVAHLVIKEKARRKEAALGGPADVVARGFGGIASNGGGGGGGYTSPHVKMGAEMNANVGVSNRNGGSRPVVVVEESVSNAGNVDRDSSNQVLAALNAVELGGGMTAQGEGSGVARADDHAPMDVDEGGMRLNAGQNVGEMNRDSSGTDLANFADMETGAGNVNNEGGNLDDVNNEMVLENKENNNGGEHVNGGRV